MDRDEIIKLVRAEWRALHDRYILLAGRLRQQQWFLLFYCSLFFAGILAFMHTQGLPALGAGERWMIRVLSLCTLLSGFILMSMLQYNLRNARKRALEIEDRFLIIRKHRRRLNGWERMQRWGSPRFLNQFPFYILFMLAILAGYLFVHWYLRSQFLLALYYGVILR
jgi:hypothetical protein